MEFSGQPEKLTIKLSKRALEKNMQDDGAAFESWALAFRAWSTDLKSVEIKWDAANIVESNAHFKRFQYRLARFCAMFDWATIHADNAKSSAWDDGQSYVLNRESKPRDGNGKPFDEAQLEIRLSKHATDKPIALPEPLRGMELHRQLPAGLFRSSVARRNAVFPAQSSAIDLWGIEGNTAWIFELKASKNRSLGIVSELFFYANLIRDSISTQRPNIAFSGETALLGCTRVAACFLGQHGYRKEAFHPLLLWGKVLDEMNKAQELVGVPMSFYSAEIDSQDTVNWSTFSPKPVLS
jgi:hypothetical protein